MLTGLILVLAGVVLLVCAALVPLLRARILSALGGVPTELQMLAKAAVPELNAAFAFINLLRPIGITCGAAGALLAVLGVYAFTLSAIPFWLTALALLAVLFLAGAGVALSVIVRKFSPQIRSLKQFTRFGL